MPSAPDGPADTTMMRIVHDALRRDLRRAQATLGGEAPLDARRRRAIAEHLRWMMTFLEAHHRSEDAGLYPLVRERDPSSAALLDDLAGEHAVVAERIRAVDSAAGLDGDDPTALLASIDELCDALLPHLEREEVEAMPVVSRSITDAEWRAIEQEQNLDGKSVAQLGLEGHWLIDGASPEDRDLVLGLVPWLPRQLLVHGFGPRYRRRRRACWGDDRRVQHHAETSVMVEVSIDAVWEVVRDPTRVGEWSHECVGAEWVGADHEPRAGARFRGRNRQGPFRWGRVCEVLAADPYELVWRTVPTRLYPDSTEWALRLAPDGRGTKIEQSFQVVKGSKLEPLYATLLPAHRDRSEQLRRDLTRIGEVAAAAPGPGTLRGSASANGGSCDHVA